MLADPLNLSHWDRTSEVQCEWMLIRCEIWKRIHYSPYVFSTLVFHIPIRYLLLSPSSSLQSRSIKNDCEVMWKCDGISLRGKGHPGKTCIPIPRPFLPRPCSSRQPRRPWTGNCIGLILVRSVRPTQGRAAPLSLRPVFTLRFLTYLTWHMCIHAAAYTAR